MRDRWLDRDWSAVELAADIRQEFDERTLRRIVVVLHDAGSLTATAVTSGAMTGASCDLVMAQPAARGISKTRPEAVSAAIVDSMWQ